ncbi:response regulator transcription factor [Pseudalkalibacillus caeni]|uniref:Response regulator n=1 Tax=Exobacillus caeni TaxID=2574798 RepID=A0A5R9F1G2_9BACL|nr:response regulator [Pseudalkalibacillus caeni]TLS36499.1 response regulator [Pseudalkalibacillus caeni]
MYNVMIVDDEPIIRFGLKSSIDWEKETLQVIGDFPNGKQALEAMETDCHVDILITDIKMPVMDGITLMKKALDINPKLKVVLVSSYNEFEYVREGLTHGAIDYILKPTLEPETLLKTVQKCVSKIHEEQNIEMKLENAERTKVQASHRKLELEMKKILLKNKKSIETEDIVSMFQVPHNIILIKIKEKDKVDEEFGFLYKSLIFEEIQERFYMETDEGVCFPIGENELVCFLRKTTDSLSLATSIKEKVEKETSIEFIYGYDVIRDLHDLVSGYHRALSACRRHFFHHEKDIFKYRPALEKDVEALSVKGLEELLLDSNEESPGKVIQERYLLWSGETMTQANIKREASNILKALFLKKVELPVLMENLSRIDTSSTLEEVYKSLMDGIEVCNHSLSNINSKPNTDNELLDKALRFIHAHYTEEMTLQSVADHIHISRNYFSILFKRLMEQNFIDYVIDLRINKAKELLVETSMKVYEVASDAGFNDVKYFSKLFKKITGHSPGDYRSTYVK